MRSRRRDAVASRHPSAQPSVGAPRRTSPETFSVLSGPAGPAGPAIEGTRTAPARTASGGGVSAARVVESGLGAHGVRHPTARPAEPTTDQRVSFGSASDPPFRVTPKSSASPVRRRCSKTAGLALTTAYAAPAPAA